MDKVLSSPTENGSGARDPLASPNAFVRLLRLLEHSDRVDPVIVAIEPVAGRLVADRRLRHLLHGEGTGVPLHVILTDVPLGAWFMAQFLDLFQDVGLQRAATRLVGLGLIGAVPTAIAGWAEWALAYRGTRRVGLFHASVNAVGTVVFVASWAARLQNRRGLGVGLARVGGAVLIVGAMAGGYMRSIRPEDPASNQAQS